MFLIYKSAEKVTIQLNIQKEVDGHIQDIIILKHMQQGRGLKNVQQIYMRHLQS